MTNKKGTQSVLSHVKYEHLAAGMIGGCTSTLMLHPLDLIKIRFAVDDGKGGRPQYRGLVDAFKVIAKKDGFTGLYRGVTPNITGAGTAWGLYFLFYNTIKTWMQGEEQKALGPGRHMLAAAESGVLTLAITNPIWVVKTRLCLQYEVKASSQTVYRGMVDALVKVYRSEGVIGLYKGFVPGLFGVSHGAIQFMVYEEMKKLYCSYKNYLPDSKLNTLEYLTFAALSKLIAASITYPYQVIRSRLQDQHAAYSGAVDVVRKIWRFEGIKGMYKGLTPYMLHVVPSICIVFLIYEYFIHATLHSASSQSSSLSPTSQSSSNVQEGWCQKTIKKRLTVDSNICETKLPVFMISETISDEHMPSIVATYVEQVDADSRQVDKETKLVDKDTKLVDKDTKLVDKDTKVVDKDIKPVI